MISMTGHLDVVGKNDTQIFFNPFSVRDISFDGNLDLLSLYLDLFLNWLSSKLTCNVIMVNDDFSSTYYP